LAKIINISKLTVGGMGELATSRIDDDERSAILPSIVQELASKRVHLKQFLKTQQQDGFHYSGCEG
jgi:hypothetical protein